MTAIRADSRASSSIRSAASPSTSATAVSVLSGVRSSWETSAANLLASACIRRIAAIDACTDAAISLIVSVSSANSSEPFVGDLASRSPAARRRAVSRSRRTGRRTPPAAASASSTATGSASRAVPIADPVRSSSRSWTPVRSCAEYTSMPEAVRVPSGEVIMSGVPTSSHGVWSATIR
ncbi:hypothetical protein GCM10029992_14200 [Glycomyces albus]